MRRGEVIIGLLAIAGVSAFLAAFAARLAYRLLEEEKRVEAYV